MCLCGAGLSKEGGREMTTVCPLCQNKTCSTHFGHFSAGGICQECFDYLEKVFQVILFSKMSRALDYLISLADKEEEDEE